MVPVHPAQAELLAAMHHICFAEPWSAVSMAEIFAMPGAFGLVATAAGEERPAGFVLARVAFDEAEILTILALPPYRRQGLGGLLLRAAMDQAQTAGARSMFLEVAENNAAGRALYAAHRFHEVGRRPNYYGGKTAALVLRAELQD